MLPTFLIIGAQKTGTTSLWQYLRGHPEAYLCEPKEPDFFLGQEAWARGRDWYEGLFAGAGDAAAVGEASTLYSMFPTYGGIPERIKSLVPEVRLIYVLRHPVDRMVSLYGHHLMAGFERRPMAEALLLDSRYADGSRYAMQVEQYLRHFPESQLLLVTSEELASDRGETLARVCRFLGIEGSWQPPNVDRLYNTRDDQRVPRDWWRRAGDIMLRTGTARFVPDVVVRHNRSRVVTRQIRPAERVLDPDIRRRLEDVLRPDVERLRAYMSPGFGAWGLLD